MTTIAAQRLSEALTKAKRIGVVEDGVTIMGCPLVLQTLRAQDYEDILAGIEELDDVAYYNAYILEHVSRSLIEIDGQDLRDTEFIEDEAPAGFLVWATLPTEELAQKLLEHVKEAGGDAGISPSEDKRKVKYERHDWLKRNVLGSWGREALTVAWQKFADLLVEADERAKDGITFRTPDETDEDKLRRLMGEVQEAMEGLPVELVDKVFKDAGMQRITTVAEMRRATERIDTLAKEAKPVEEPTPAKPVGKGPSVTAADLMKGRTPLNQQAVEAPAPRGPEVTPQPARSKVLVPEQLRQAALRNTAGMSKRTQTIAQLEGAVDPSVVEEAQAQQQVMPSAEEVPVLEKKSAPFQPGEAAKIIEQPPVAGINPRFKPPPR